MDDLPQSWSIDEICEAWQISPGQLMKLIRDGKVGFYKGKRGSRRFFPEHLEQIREAIEVKPQPVMGIVSGQSPRSAAHWRRKALQEGWQID